MTSGALGKRWDIGLKLASELSPLSREWVFSVDELSVTHKWGEWNCASHTVHENRSSLPVCDAPGLHAGHKKGVGNNKVDERGSMVCQKRGP